MKTLIKIGVIIVLLVVAAVVVVGMYLGTIIKAGIEDVGPKITGTTIKLDAVDLSLLSGQVRVKGLVVGNPKGFQTPNAFKLGDSEVGVDLQSALTDKVIIKEILIDGAEVTYETGPSGNNVNKIQENVSTFAKSAAPHGAGESKAQKKSSTQKKVEIDDFIFKNGKATVSASMLGGKPITISLPDIHLKDIGKSSGGVSPETAAAEVFKAVEKAVAQSVSKSAGEAAKSIGSAAGKSESQAVEGIKGLFGK